MSVTDDPQTYDDDTSQVPYVRIMQQMRAALVSYDAARPNLVAGYHQSVLDAHEAGLSNAQLADLLGVSRKTVEAMCSKARKAPVEPDATDTTDLTKDDF